MFATLYSQVVRAPTCGIADDFVRWLIDAFGLSPQPRKRLILDCDGASLRCLAEPQIFQAQLRALLRASNHGTIRLLIPMLAHAHEIDQTLVDERVAQFRDQVRRRVAGELSEEEFRPLRLMNGLYLQLHAYMLRVAIPYGTLSSPQMRQQFSSSSAPTSLTLEPEGPPPPTVMVTAERSSLVSPPPTPPWSSSSLKAW